MSIIRNNTTSEQLDEIGPGETIRVNHEDCYAEVGSQGVSYTTGVPAMIGAMLMMNGTWRGEGVFNMEQLDPDPFMEKLNIHGLPWTVSTPDEVNW